jgi:hypothetical protein
MGTGLGEAWWSRVCDQAEESEERLGAAHNLSACRRDDGEYEEAERIAGTDPRNAQSVLRLGVSGAPGFPLTWSSVAGRRYTILRSRRIDGPWEVWRSGIPATPGANVHPDSSLTSDAQPWYYRLAVE